MKHFFEFGEFRLDAETPSLWRDSELVPIFPKALDILVLLVGRRGGVVSREELLESVWRDAFVEESNITYTVSLLRKTLDEHDKGRFIQTLPKRGYRFSADVRDVTETDEILARVLSNGFGRDDISEGVRANPPKAEIRWHFIAIILLGLFFVTSFAVWWNLGGERGLSDVPVKQRNIRTIAILPLKTLTPSEQSNALSVGLSDSLISRLGSLNRFAVRPLNSVIDYTETGKDPLKFGEELRVDAVLEGTLQTSDNRLRVNLRLWDVRDGAQLWQDSFDSAEVDLFSLQDAIATRVTQSLVDQLLDQDRMLLARRDTENRDAFDSYWRGRFFLEKRDPERAIVEFQEAVKLDPAYALAYSGLADAYIWQASFTSGSDPALYEKAKTSTVKALELAPNLADAHSSLGRIKYLNDWDWPGAEDSVRRAIELDPNSVNAHQSYARLLATLGRYDEGLTEIYKARELDPRSADLGVPLYAILEKQGKFDEGLKVLATTIEMDKDSDFARRGTGKLYLLKGDYAKVIELGSELFTNPNQADFAWASMLATAYHGAGKVDAAAEMRIRLKRMAETDPKSLYFLAMHDSELGRTDEAVAALRKCLETREERMIWTKDEPRFANLKDDPRFRQILREMRLAE
ncbi:MAG: winged helix-turn-helix domain-containing protein [Pyrinomonadaceae bacterium]